MTYAQHNRLTLNTTKAYHESWFRDFSKESQQTTVRREVHKWFQDWWCLRKHVSSSKYHGSTWSWSQSSSHRRRYYRNKFHDSGRPYAGQLPLSSTSPLNHTSLASRKGASRGKGQLGKVFYALKAYTYSDVGTMANTANLSTACQYILYLVSIKLDLEELPIAGRGRLLESTALALFLGTKIFCSAGSDCSWQGTHHSFDLQDPVTCGQGSFLYFGGWRLWRLLPSCWYCHCHGLFFSRGCDSAS